MGTFPWAAGFNLVSFVIRAERDLRMSSDSASASTQVL